MTLFYEGVVYRRRHRSLSFSQNKYFYSSHGYKNIACLCDTLPRSLVFIKSRAKIKVISTND
ncbi:hypothetical protein [uncultured Nostoc sp.]|uniref:hypothetical protein n=1 Tax=uncultured Nostoc sp. TaxID=340711 RepID=UPI0035C9F284